MYRRQIGKRILVTTSQETIGGRLERIDRQGVTISEAVHLQLGQERPMDGVVLVPFSSIHWTQVLG